MLLGGALERAKRVFLGQFRWLFCSKQSSFQNLLLRELNKGKVAQNESRLLQIYDKYLDQLESIYLTSPIPYEDRRPYLIFHKAIWIFEDARRIQKFIKIVTNNYHLQHADNWQMSILLHAELTRLRRCSQKQRLKDYSPVINEFLQFFLQSSLLSWTYKYSITSKTMKGIFQEFIANAVFKGFLSRRPQYTRSLQVNPEMIVSLLLTNLVLNKCLDSLISQAGHKRKINKDSKNSIKELYRFIFMQQFNKIYVFYQQQMHENIYHRKNVQLLQKLLMPIMKEQILWEPAYEPQIPYLVELYIKSYLITQKADKASHTHKNSVYVYEWLVYYKYQGDIISQFIQAVKAEQKNHSSLIDTPTQELLHLIISLDCQKAALSLLRKQQYKAILSHWDLVTGIVAIHNESILGYILSIIEQTMNQADNEAVNLSHFETLWQVIRNVKKESISPALVISLFRRILSVDITILDEQPHYLVLLFEMHNWASAWVASTQQHYRQVEVFIYRYLLDHINHFPQHELNSLYSLISQNSKYREIRFDDGNGNHRSINEIVAQIYEMGKKNNPSSWFS